MKRAISWITSILVFLIPLFFLPITAEFYEFNKNYLLWLGVIICFVLWLIKTISSSSLEIKSSNLTLPLFIWAGTYLLSALLASPNKTEAFLLPGGAGTILGLVLFYFLLLNLIEEKEKIFWALTISGAVLGLITIYQFFGLGEVLIPEKSPLAFARGKTWTPTGSLLVTATFLFILIPQILVKFKQTLKSNFSKAAILGVILILLAGGLGISVYQLLPGKPAALLLLPYRIGWAIAVEAFKQAPLWGVGPLNFISAFNRFRPTSYNLYNFWNLRFGNSSSFLLQIWTETGLLGVIAFAILFFKLIKIIKKSKKISEYLGILASLLVFLFLPVGFSLIFAFIILLVTKSQETKIVSLKLSRKILWLPGIVSILIMAPVLYFAGRAYAAEIYFKKSLNALIRNDGLGTYNNQIRAIQLNPRRTDFRLAYSQTNFALANNIANNPPTGQITDQDRSNITQLVSQAIREARIAVSLNPTNAIVWENLAQLYRNLINFAQGADQWALTAYQQAINTDPINPRLRLDYGGLFYSLQNYEEAQKIFRVAVELKPDYANAWYNLAAAYREDQRYPQAYQSMQQALALVPANSPDWEKAKKELDDLAKKLPSLTPTPSPSPSAKPEENLTPPQPLPSPALEKPIELPPEASPGGAVLP